MTKAVVGIKEVIGFIKAVLLWCERGQLFIKFCVAWPLLPPPPPPKKLLGLITSGYLPKTSKAHCSIKPKTYDFEFNPLIHDPKANSDPSFS